MKEESIFIQALDREILFQHDLAELLGPRPFDKVAELR
jgi:hypothetical protein